MRKDSSWYKLRSIDASQSRVWQLLKKKEQKEKSFKRCDIKLKGGSQCTSASIQRIEQEKSYGWFLFLHFPLLTYNTSIFYFSYLPEIAVSLILHKKYMRTKAGSPIFKQTGQNEAQTDTQIFEYISDCHIQCAHLICMRASSEGSNMPLGQILPTTIYATMCLSHSTALNVHMKRTMDIARGPIIDDLKITIVCLENKQTQ